MLRNRLSPQLCRYTLYHLFSVYGISQNSGHLLSGVLLLSLSFQYWDYWWETTPKTSPKGQNILYEYKCKDVGHLVSGHKLNRFISIWEGSLMISICCLPPDCALLSNVWDDMIAILSPLFSFRIWSSMTQPLILDYSVSLISEHPQQNKTNLNTLDSRLVDSFVRQHSLRLQHWWMDMNLFDFTEK